jgi:hypothetical protein
MLWIESHTNLADHPKTRKLTRRLDIPIPLAVGFLTLLWHWAMEYAEEGDLSRHDAEDIAVGARWEGEAETFVGALVAVGFIDETDDGLALHDWTDYAGRYIRGREQRREAGRRSGEARRRSTTVQRPANDRSTGAATTVEHPPTVPTSPTTAATDDDDELRKRLTAEGFSSEAIEHALQRLRDSGRVTSPLAYGRTVAANFALRRANEDLRHVEAEQLKSCRACDAVGRTLTEEGAPLEPVEYCDHSEVAGARPHGRPDPMDDS